jgi:hypothetical protein
MCVSNICHDDENGSELLQSLHMIHDIESCDQGGEDEDMTWLDGPVAIVKGKSEALKRGTACDGEA